MPKKVLNTCWAPGPVDVQGSALVVGEVGHTRLRDIAVGEGEQALFAKGGETA